MKSRIKRQNADKDNEKIKIIMDEDEPDPRAKKIYKSKISNQTLHSDDVDIVASIVHRHDNMLDTDPFGRNDIFRIMSSRIASGTWPEIKTIVGVSDTENFQRIQYQKIADRLVEEYYTEMTARNEFQPVSILKTIPVIDIHNLFNLYKTNTNSVAWLIMNFDDREIYDIQSTGWKTLLPYFPEQIIRVNGYRYIYVKVLDSNKQEKSMTLHFETYIGTETAWVCRIKTDIRFKFEENANAVACEIEAENTSVYEQMLSKGLKYMKKWTKQEKALWQDMFCVPSSPSDLILLQLRNNENVPDVTTFIFGAKEHGAMLRTFGQACVHLKDDARSEEISRIMRMTYIEQYVNTMATIFIKLRDDCSTETDDDGWMTQNYNGMTVRSKTLIQRKGV